jgi:nicotinate-nucleotide adenylyltransferase
MGGTFDPPHIGHFQIAAEVGSRERLDRVLFVPASQPWQKSAYADAEDRFNMTVLGAASDTRFVVSRMEIDRKGPTYTVDTMSILSELCPGVEFVLILGADAALNLPTWHRIDELIRSTRMLAVTRPDFDLSELQSDPILGNVQILEVSPVEVSSTQIRAAVREGLSIQAWVPAAVAEYITQHGLYAAERALG